MLRPALGILAVLSFLPAGCGGFSEEDATAWCDQESNARGVCSPAGSAAYDQCISCYEDCGNDCQAQNHCPEEWVCPE